MACDEHGEAGCASSCFFQGGLRGAVNVAGSGKDALVDPAMKRNKKDTSVVTELEIGCER
jgi:hypothetical protein